MAWRDDCKRSNSKFELFFGSPGAKEASNRHVEVECETTVITSGQGRDVVVGCSCEWAVSECGLIGCLGLEGQSIARRGNRRWWCLELHYCTYLSYLLAKASPPANSSNVSHMIEAGREEYLVYLILSGLLWQQQKNWHKLE